MVVALTSLGGGPQDEAASTLELKQEIVALQGENQLMAEELSAITPDFFDEIDRLRSNYAQAQAQLTAYSQRFGIL